MEITYLLPVFLSTPLSKLPCVGKFLDRDKCLKTLNGDLTTVDFCRLLKKIVDIMKTLVRHKGFNELIINCEDPEKSCHYLNFSRSSILMKYC